MVECFEIEVDIKCVNEFWNVEVEKNLKLREVFDDVFVE